MHASRLRVERPAAGRISDVEDSVASGLTCGACANFGSFSRSLHRTSRPRLMSSPLVILSRLLLFLLLLHLRLFLLCLRLVLSAQRPRRLPALLSVLRERDLHPWLRLLPLLHSPSVVLVPERRPTHKLAAGDCPSLLRLLHGKEKRRPLRWSLHGCPLRSFT